jgi:uncharacterized protein (TIGR03437 family)
VPPFTVGITQKIDYGIIAVNGTINSVNFTSSGTLPPGMTFANVTTASGTVAEVAGKPTTAGTFNFNISAVANMSTGIFSGTLPVTLVVSNPAALISPSSLTFSPRGIGAYPSLQRLDVSSTGSTPVRVTATLTDGNGGAAPTEITILPPVETTPATFFVQFTALPTSTPGTKTAQVTLSAPGTPSVKVDVSGVILSTPVPVSALPPSLNFRANSSQSGTIHRKTILRGSFGRYSGRLPISFPGLSVTQSGTFSPEGLAVVDLSLNLDQLSSRDDFNDLLLLTYGDATLPIPIFFSSARNPFLGIFASRQRYENPFGSSASPFGQFTIFNTGPPGSTINFSSTIQYRAGGPRFLNFGNITNPQTGAGSVTPEKPFVLPFLLTPQTQAGVETALVTVTDQNNPSLLEEFTFSLLTGPSGPPVVDLSPAATVFPAATGTALQTKTFAVSTTGPAVAFSTSVSTVSGGNWLSVSPSSGSVSSAFSPNLTITVNPASVPPGADLGYINFRTATGDRSLTEFVFAINPRTGATGQVREAAACTPTRVVIAPVGLASGFTRAQGLPDGLSAEIYDDCGNALTGPENTVVAAFDNGDPPVVLENLGAGAGQGAYLGAWTPVTAQANTTVTFIAASGNLLGATVLSGTVTANQLNLPVLVAGGTVNNTNPLGGPVLAPGMVTSIYGLNLAPSPLSPGMIPLPNTANGTSVSIGGKPAPFYFVSPGQLNVQAPTDLVPGDPAPVAVQANSAFAVLPGTVSVFAAAPGVSSFADGHIIAQHADFSLVDAAHPAKPGESLVMYLSGMGATTPSVATGQQASATSFTPAQIQPVVTVGGRNAAIAYAGLTPGGIGLYQINFAVPTGLAAGDNAVIVSQGGVAANQTMLPVGAP